MSKYIPVKYRFTFPYFQNLSCQSIDVTMSILDDELQKSIEHSIVIILKNANLNFLENLISDIRITAISNSIGENVYKQELIKSNEIGWYWIYDLDKFQKLKPIWVSNIKRYKLDEESSFNVETTKSERALILGME